MTSPSTSPSSLSILFKKSVLRPIAFYQISLSLSHTQNLPKTPQVENMYGNSRGEPPYDYTSEFPPAPLFIPIPGAAEHDSLSALRSEIGYTSSGCSSYGGSPTPYSPTLMQRSISSLSLHGNMDVYSAINSSPAPYCDYDTTSVRKVLSTGDLQGPQQQSPRLNSPLMNESSIIESMSRASPYSPEEKKERIERYRSKRNLRNFNKKIKYECRKTLADSRPRIRGRFARNDETDKAPQTQSQWEEHNQEEEEDDNWINFIDSFSANLMP